jgi:predicted DNA-binding protein
MSGTAQPTSIRLSEATRLLLDKSARETRRSRSYLVEQALKAHLPRIAEKEKGLAAKTALDRLMALRRLADSASNGLGSDEIDARSREFRGDD